MTKTKTLTDHIAERFARETATHEMKILHDDGFYRHLKFKTPGDSSYWYELITAPNSLTFRGDGESFVFSRLADMFEFFRSNPDRKAHRISPDYWAEKLTSDRDSVKGYSREKFEQAVAEHLADVEEGWPGVTAAWAAAMDDTVDYDLEYEQSAQQALSDFEFGAKTVAVCRCGERIEVGADDLIPVDWRDKHPRGRVDHAYMTDRTPGFRFRDTWEWDFKDFDWWYLWACHGIVAGIAQYDAAKAEAARPVETVAVTSGAV
jgi:hypothetical protein